MSLTDQGKNITVTILNTISDMDGTLLACMPVLLMVVYELSKYASKQLHNSLKEEYVFRGRILYRDELEAFLYVIIPGVLFYWYLGWGSAAQAMSPAFTYIVWTQYYQRERRYFEPTRYELLFEATDQDAGAWLRYLNVDDFIQGDDKVINKLQPNALRETPKFFYNMFWTNIVGRADAAVEGCEKTGSVSGMADSDQGPGDEPETVEKCNPPEGAKAETKEEGKKLKPPMRRMKVPKLIGNYLSMVRVKFGVVEKTKAGEMSVRRFLNTVMSVNHVRVKDQQFVIPIIIALSMSPSEIDLYTAALLDTDTFREEREVYRSMRRCFNKN